MPIKRILIAYIIFSTPLLNAQEDSKSFSLEEDSGSRISTSLQSQNFGDSQSQNVVVNFGSEIRSYYFGIVGQGMLTPVKKNDGDEPYKFNMYGAGLCFEYTALEWENMRLATETIAGAINLNARDSDKNLSSMQIKYIKPAVSVGYAPNKRSTLFSLELGYQKTSSFQWHGLADKDLNGLFAGIKVSTTLY